MQMWSIEILVQLIADLQSQFYESPNIKCASILLETSARNLSNLQKQAATFSHQIYPVYTPYCRNKMNMMRTM